MDRASVPPLRVVVRAARVEDLATPAVAGPGGEYRTQLAELLEGGDDVVLLVATSGGDVVGRVGVRAAGRAAEIVGLVVEATHRRRGVGTALLDAAERWARDRGCATVRLTVGQHNADAIRLYDGRGYHVVGTGWSEGLVDPAGTVVHEPEPVWVLRRELPAP